LTTSFLNCTPFISSSCCIALAKNSKTILSKSGKSEHPCLVPFSRGNGFGFPHFSIMLAIGFLYIAFLNLR
jgi:hypothetical protein